MTKQPKLHRREFDIQSMGATIDRLAVFYSPIKCSPLLPVGDKQARLAMPVKKEEVKLAMPVQREEVKMATLKEEELAIVEVKVVNCLKPSNSVELAQPQGGLVSGTMPAPLPAHQPITFLSKPLDVEDAEDDDCVVFGGAHQEEIGVQTASQGELIALIPKVKEPIVNQEVEEPVLNKEVVMIDATQVEEEVAKHVEAMILAKEEVIVVEDEEKETTIKLVEEEEESLGHVEEEGFTNHVEEFSFSVEGFEYDENTGLISYQHQPVEFATPQLREQVLAKMFQVINEGSSNPLSMPASPKGLESSPISHKPLNLRHQERRLTFGHLSQTKVQSLGRRTSWTKSLLMSDLEAAFSKPRRGIIWSDFSPEEKLAHFDMVNWEATFPLDPPPRSLMLEPEEDQWSTWA